MPKPYTYDLRQKVIQAIELDGMKKSEAEESFSNQSKYNQPLASIDLPAREITKRYQINHSCNGHKITDWEKFEKFVEVNGDKTQVDMAKLWSVEISDCTISRALKKIGFTTWGYPLTLRYRKKNLWLSRTR